MTREEAIEILWRYDVDFEPHPPEEVMHAIDMAIEALQTEVVRCKDCRHRVHDEERGLYYCERYYGQGDVSDENFCQWGERKAR